MCACRPCSGEARRSPGTRAIASRRVGHREAELRVGLAGGDLLVRLAAHVGGDAHQHGLGAARRSRAPSTQQPLQAVDLVEVVDHDQPPRDGAGAIRSSASDLALPCSTIRSGAKPAASARCSSPPEATSHHRPSCCEQREHRRAGERLGGEHHVEVGVAGLAPGVEERARARRAGRPRRPRRPASRTRARARSCRSRRPPGGRAR